MRKKTLVTLMLALSLMVGSINVGAAENAAADVAVQQVEAVSDELVMSDEPIVSEPEESDELVMSDEPIVSETEDVVPQTTQSEKTADKQLTEYVWQQADGKVYVCDEDGDRVWKSGTPIIGGEKYYIAGDGYLMSGWLILGNWKMYFDTETYTAKKGFSVIDGKTYLFNSDGVMQNYAGTTIIDGKKYWFSDDNASLKTGWLDLGQWKLYFDPETFAAKTGLSEINGHMYIFSDDGAMQGYSGTPVINGEKYWVAPEGYLKSGWLYLTNWKMYFDPVTYQAKRGIVELDGKMYLFNRDGVMQNYAGTTIIDGKKYWFSDDNASLKTGWLDLLGMKLYFDPETYEGAVGFEKIDGKTYYFDHNGVMQTGLQKVNGKYYYFGDNGVMQTNVTKEINGIKMKFGADGACTNPVFSGNYAGPYLIKVDRTNCVITIYGDDGSGRFEYPVKAFVCSVGKASTPTPAGTYYTGARYKVKALMGPSWGQYSIHVVNGIYFHSVAAGSATDPGHTVPVGEYYKLGRPASHGCIRMLVGDAYWMYKNIPTGTKVIIGDNFPMPLGKPSVPTMVTPGVDPTDPFNK